MNAQTMIRPTSSATSSTESLRQQEFHGEVIRAAHQEDMEQMEAHVRVLLHRNQWYAAQTSLLAKVVAQTIRRYAIEQTPERVALLVLAMFDVRTQDGLLPREGHAAVAARIAGKIAEAGIDNIERAVTESLGSAMGQQVRVTGWLPGFRVTEGKQLRQLTGEACPSCKDNPGVIDPQRGRSATARCLNSEDCGWREKRRKNRR